MHQECACDTPFYSSLIFAVSLFYFYDISFRDLRQKKLCVFSKQFQFRRLNMDVVCFNFSYWKRSGYFQEGYIAGIILLPVELSRFLPLCLLLFFKITARPLLFPFTSCQIRVNNWSDFETEVGFDKQNHLANYKTFWFDVSFWREAG